MKKVEIYLNSNNELMIDIYKQSQDEYQSAVYKGVDAYNFIRKISNNEIIKINDKKNLEECSFIYNDFIIRINEYKKLLKIYRKWITPLLQQVTKFYEKENLRKLNKTKLIKKNKYTKNAIIASFLATLAIGFTVKGLPKETTNSQEKPTTNIETTDLYAFIDDELDTYQIPSQQLTNTQNEQINSVSIEYEDRSMTEKAIATEKNYGDLINKYANMYGLDPKLVLSIATQESGEHSGVINEAAATGLMQVETQVWLGNTIDAYNFNTQSWEEFEVSLNDLSELELNIKLGCMILQKNLIYMDYNILLALQSYNMGIGNMSQVLDNYCLDNNCSKQDLLNDPTNTQWLNYRNFSPAGDPLYIEHVLSWYGNNCDINLKKTDGTTVSLNVNNEIVSKKTY